MNWPFVLSLLEAISHFLLLVTYGALVFLAFQHWSLPDAKRESKLNHLYGMGLFIISLTLLVHALDHLLRWHHAAKIHAGVAIALYGTVILLMAGLMYRLLPLVTELLPQGSQPTLAQIRQQLSHTKKEQKATQFALQHSQDRFRSIFDQAAMGIAILSDQGLVLEANQAYYQMLAQSTDTEDCYFFNGIDREGMARDRVILTDLFRHKQSPYGYTKRYLKEGHTPLWFNVQLSLVEPDNPQQKPYAIAMLEDITQQKQTEQVLVRTQERLQTLLQVRADQITQMNEELSWQSSHDHLTGLLNRIAFERQLTNALKFLKRNPKITEHTLCYLNLDRFKAINEVGGILAGDEVLRQVSQLIESRCRPTDFLARLGSDEFALLLNQCPLEKARLVAQSIVDGVQKASFTWDNQQYKVSASIGLVPINNAFGDAAELIMAADAACFAAKKRGRSRIHVYESNDQELARYRSEAQWIQKIEAALLNGGFVLYAQPILPLSAPQTNYARNEVLIRMVGDDGEVINPGLFLPAAERYHLMTKIDYWVIENTLKYLSEQGSGILTKYDCYSINLSGASINGECLVDFLQTQFERYPVATERICFEVTETVAIANLSRANEVIQSIRAMGCKIALDDFGSGMSSFNYLKYLPVDYLKIDGSFIKDIANDEIDYAMVETINRIGHVMGIETVAEYVADEIILEKIKQIGIDYAQGFGIARPVPLYQLQSQPQQSQCPSQLA